MEACPTKILLANAEAANVQSRRLYEAVGLNDREIQIVQGTIPKRQYYVISPEGRRLISLGLGGVALAFVGVNSPDDRKKAEEVMRAHPAPGKRSGCVSEAARIGRTGGAKLREFLKGEYRHEKSNGVHSCAVHVVLGGPAPTDAGVLAGVATEWTQILNHVQLIMGYIRQGLQLENELRQYAEQLKTRSGIATAALWSHPADLSQLSQVVQGGQALAYSMGNLDAQFRNTFPGYSFRSQGISTTTRSGRRLRSTRR